MEPNIAILIGLGAATIGMAGALLSQLINVLFNLKVKRMELVYARKADSYKNLMEKAGAFVNDSYNQERYIEFIHAYYATVIIASPSVLAAFEAQGNITEIISRFRVAADKADEYPELKESWLSAMNKLVNIMRDDLQRLSKH